MQNMFLLAKTPHGVLTDHISAVADQDIISVSS